MIRILLSLMAMLLAGLIALSANRAFAHDLYEWECCSDMDCGAAKDGDVIQTKDGWLIVPLDTVVPYDRTRTSFDSQFHYCQQGGFGGTGALITAKGRACLYVPAQGF